MNTLATVDHKPLSPIYADEARDPLLIMLAAYPEPFTERGAEQVDNLHKARVSAYLMGLEGLPGWAIEKGVREFIAGKVDRPARSRGKLPTVEELATQDPRACPGGTRSGRRNSAASASRKSADAPDPAPFEIRMEQDGQEFAGRAVLFNDVNYDKWRALSASKQVPVGGQWCPSLGTVFGPPVKAGE